MAKKGRSRSKVKKYKKKFQKSVIKLLTFSKSGHILLAIKAKDC